MLILTQNGESVVNTFTVQEILINEGLVEDKYAVVAYFNTNQDTHEILGAYQTKAMAANQLSNILQEEELMNDVYRMEADNA